MKKLLIVASVILALSGCSTYSTPRYSTSTDNIISLRSLAGKVVNVGPFTAKEPGLNEIMCRQSGPVNTQDGEPFSEFIRKALIDELRMANVYSASAPVTLTGRLDNIDYDSNNGSWDLSLTIKSSNGKSVSLTEHYSYTTSFIGKTACAQAAQALVPATQNIIGKLVRSPEFNALITP